MARIRTVKPDMWTSEQIVECSRDARLLFIGLWNFCDDGGVHPNSAKTIKGRVFPSDDIDSATVRRWLDELVSNGLLAIFEADGLEYLWVTGWDKHQKVDRPNYKHPRPPTDLRKRATSSANTRRVIAEASPPEGKGKEVEGNPPTPLPNSTSDRRTEPAAPSPEAIARVMSTAHRERFTELKAEEAAKLNADPVQVEAREILATYGRAVREVWALDLDPIPREGDLGLAKAWAKAGITAKLCLDVFGPVLTRKRDKGDGAQPTSLNYLDGAVRRAHAEKGSPTLADQVPPDPTQEQRAKRYLAALERHDRLVQDGRPSKLPDHAAYMRGDHDAEDWPEMPDFLRRPQPAKPAAQPVETVS